ncbi:MAG: Crp/Fnr family transcriptional regulator [Pseudomonadota bacterium]
MVGKDDLKKITIFTDLPEEMIEAIGSIAQIQDAEEETVLFEQEQDLSTLYMLLSGTVFLNSKSPSGKMLTLDQVVPGQSFGVSALMGRGRSSFTAICGLKSRLVTVSSDKLKGLFEKDPKLGYQVMLRVVKRFKSRTDKHTKQFLHYLATHPDIKGLA